VQKIKEYLGLLMQCKCVLVIVRVESKLGVLRFDAPKIILTSQFYDVLISFILFDEKHNLLQQDNLNF